MKCGSVGTRPSGSCSPTGGPIRSPALVTTTRSARIGASVGLFRPCSGVVTVSASNPQPRRRPIKAVISEQTPPMLGSAPAKPGRSSDAWRSEASRQRLALGSAAAESGVRGRRGSAWRSEAPRQSLAFGGAVAAPGARKRRGRVWRSGRRGSAWRSEAPRQSLALGSVATAPGARKRRGRVWRSGAPRQRLALGSLATAPGARKRRGRVWRAEAPR